MDTSGRHHQQPAKGKLMGSQPRLYNHQHHHNTSLESNESSASSQVQRKIFSFFYIYAILVVTLYVTYAGWYFYHHSQQQQQQQPLRPAQSEPLVPAAGKLGQQQQQQDELLASSDAAWKQEFEIKFKFFEKYVEMLSSELQETQKRLQEREKCDCQLSCTFNGTRYADRSSWQNQCDTCTCQSGKISCQPQKCPQFSCDDPVQLAGQCCPVCMKRCKYNSSTIRHGQKFSPPETNKECKCQDGRIKCEQRKLGGSTRAAVASFATSEPQAAATRKAKGASELHHQHQSEQVAATPPVAATNKAIPTSKDNGNADKPPPTQMTAASNRTTSGLKRQVELPDGLLLIGGGGGGSGASHDAQLADSTIEHQMPARSNNNIANG